MQAISGRFMAGSVTLVIIVLLGFLNNFMRIRFGKKAPDAYDIFLGRLFNPNLPLIEKHYAHPLPSALKHLFDKPSNLEGAAFEVKRSESGDKPWNAWYVHMFLPLDSETLVFGINQLNGLLPIAEDGAGHFYVIDPQDDNPEVILWRGQGEPTQPLEIRLNEFLSAWNRNS